MRIIGIDPGTIKTGYGIIEDDTGQLVPIAYGVISAPSNETIELRLLSIYRELKLLFHKFKPDVAAIEEPFVSNNVRSAISIGRAQAIAMLVASEKQVPVFRYSPAQVKQQVTNYGTSLKNQVNNMVKIHLDIRQEDIQEDAADALAIAICHLNLDRLNRFIEKKGN